MRLIRGPGTMRIPATAGHHPASTRETMDAAVAEVRARSGTWSEMKLPDRIALLDRLQHDFAAVATPWVDTSVRSKGIDPSSAAVADEWLGGPYCIFRNLRLLRRSLAEIAAFGRPRIPGPVSMNGRGQVVARVFPTDGFDRVLFRGYSAEVWMEPGETRSGLPEGLAPFYRTGPRAGRVALVLGAGNVSSIGPMDLLHKLFVEGQVVVLKMNPVNDDLGPLLAEGFRALIEDGYLRVVYGGALEGEYLCRHAEVDEIHVTGSDKTYEAIVFGTGEDEARRKAERRLLVTKPVTGELGNVSPVIVVPGPWSGADISFHAVNLASQLANNAGFNCNSTRVIVQHAGSRLRQPLIDSVRQVLSALPTRRAYYPGAAERHASFLASHPEAEQFGSPGDGELPWTLVAAIDPSRRDDPCFACEAFCSLFAETAIPAVGVSEFLDRAVTFCNETLWGSLCATLIVHPASLADPEIAAAVERAIAELRYGTIAINTWVALAYTMGSTTWGAFPGHEPWDIQSGTGVVHNTLMFSRAQKSVVRGPFRPWPTPPWFVGRRGAAKLASRLARLEARPSIGSLSGVLVAALRG